MVGLWVRTLCDESFDYVLIGNLIAAIVQPFILNCPQKISADWFKSGDV